MKNGPCWNRSFTRFSPVISGRSCTSTPCASGKAAPTIRGETGGNQWLHPNIVAMEPVDKAWGKHVKACGHASGSTCVRLWSFEVKKMLTVANIRKCFFQAVSNSSWAHEGYLVATAIADDRVEQELRMLSALHGIGVILLDPENPSESEILLPAQKKPDADWQSIDRLAKENGDFHEFIELVSVYFQTGTLREKDWDNKTA